MLAQPARVEKRRSPRLAELRVNRTAFDPDKVHTRITTQIVTITMTKTRITKFIDDGESDDSCPASLTAVDELEELTDSDSESDFDTSCPSSPESEEHVGFSGDKFEYMAADPLDRHDSYDSRLEPGNEDYLQDDFVVADSCSEDRVFTVGSEITIADDTDESSSETDSETTILPKAFSKRKLIRKATARRISNLSIASPGSGLSITNNEQHKLTTLSSIPESAFKAMSNDIGPSDVAEEIMDAICRFTRRCNRHCPPLRLELTSDFLEDEEVAEAMERGVKRGLGKCEQLDVGRVLYTVGPPSE